MSTERIIHLADLAFINNSLSNISHGIATLDTRVEGVGRELSSTRSELARLEQMVRDFISADAKAKELQLAETRQVKIRQELETKYGYYAEVRRHASGILQAADISIVRQETLTAATEELMLAAPRYWLAPALVALSAWLNNNQPLANKALAEAIRRDDEKTSLFFALICRRAARASACQTWLDRYLGMQDPMRLDRQTVVLVDALASGTFGPEVRNQCTSRIEEWIEELAQRAGFVEEQRQQWNMSLRSKIPNTDNGQRYVYLSKYSSTWSALNNLMNSAALHKIVHDYFTKVFEGPIPTSPSVQAAVDNLLDKLVKNFDDEELPLRRDERLCQLIIEESGNRAAAKGRFDMESKALDEHISCTQLLTNAAMHPETSQASRATQRYAIALSRSWIKDAHQDLTASIRSAVPAQVEFAIEDWQGKTRNGENESELVDSLGNHIERRKDTAIAAVKLQLIHWAALVIGIGFLLTGLPKFQYLPLAIGAGCLIWFYSAKTQQRKARMQIAADYAKLKEQSLQTLKGMLAETVEWRREFAQRDALAPNVTQLLDTITPQQYVLSSHDSIRHVMAKPAA